MGRKKLKKQLSSSLDGERKLYKCFLKERSSEKGNRVLLRMLGEISNKCRTIELNFCITVKSS